MPKKIPTPQSTTAARSFRLPRSAAVCLTVLAALALLQFAPGQALAASAAQPTQPTQSVGKTKPAAAAQLRFESPEQAVEALVAASRAHDSAQVTRILGPRSRRLIRSGNAASDKEHREKFLASYDTFHSLEQRKDGSMVLVVGERKWPMPLPLVQTEGGWRFDTAAGEQEILNRRIGRHELDVLEVCRAYVSAQREYGEAHRLADGTPEYAQRLTSRPGRRDGLYWPSAAGEPESPLGPLMASAQGKGGKHKPYHGYLYRILTAQGPSASGGGMQYIEAGRMTKGFALIAYPARYGESGVKTFLVNQNGIVRAKDLGPDTARAAAKIRVYDPDASWQLP